MTTPFEVTPQKYLGMGSVLYAAGGSLGQTRSSAVFDHPARAAQRLLDNAPRSRPFEDEGSWLLTDAEHVGEDVE